MAAVGTGHVPDDGHGLVFGKCLLVEEFAAAGGEAVEERLSDVGQDGGVTARDEAASGQLEEVGEELVDRGGGGEVLELAEKVGGARFAQGLWGLAAMLLAERGMARAAELTALAAEGRDVLAMIGGAWFAGHLIDLLGDGETSERRNVASSNVGRLKKDPPPPAFFVRV